MVQQRVIVAEDLKTFGIDKEAFLRGLLNRPGVLRAASKSVRKDAVRSASKYLPKKAPDWFKKSFKDNKTNPNKIWRAYRDHSMSSGDESLLMWPVKALAEKMTKSPKRLAHIRGSTWKYMGAPALRADMALGRVLEKTPVIGKTLFRVKDKVRWGHNMEKSIERPSALAPFIKARNIAEPFLVGVGLEKGLKALSGKKQQGQDMKDQQLREKVASVMLSLHERNKEHEKRAHALKILYKQAELGHAPLPQTHSELETKLAALVNEDLVVLDKALELAGGNIKLGELDHIDLKAGMNPAEKFQATILGDEF